MKAAIIHNAGEVPAFGSFANPSAQPGELKLRVTASALTPLTRARASGQHYSSSGQFPLVPGVDGTGRGEDGQRVYFLLPRAPYGALAEETVAPVAHCIALPDGLDDVTAAAIANPGMSSWAALTERARFKAGETVLINGATGASGQLAVQIAKHMGAGKVIATGRDEGALHALASLGADVLIPLTGDADDLEAKFKEQFAQRIDAVLDYLWGVSAERLLIAAAKASPEGIPVRFVQIGNASGANITLPGAVLRSSAIELMGSGLGSVPLERLLAAIGGVFKAAIAARLTLAAKTMPLPEIGAAWALSERQRIVITAG